MLSSTLDCRLPCSFYSSPFIWVKLEQVASLYAFFANSILNFEAVQVLVISRRIFREDKFVILLRLEKFAVLRWREKLVQSPLTSRKCRRAVIVARRHSFCGHFPLRKNLPSIHHHHGAGWALTWLKESLNIPQEQYIEDESN